MQESMILILISELITVDLEISDLEKNFIKKNLKDAYQN